MSEPPQRELWSEAARERSLGALFAASLVAVSALFARFADSLVFASATVVVTWPLFAWLLRRTAGRRYVAAGLATALVVLLLLIPTSVFATWVARGVVDLVQQTIEFLRSPEFVAELRLARAAEVPGAAWITELLGPDVDPVAWLLDSAQRALGAAGQGAAKALPDVVGSVVGASLDAIVYVGAVVTLYAEGPRLLKAAARVSPLRLEHQRRLFDVFREFSTNLVRGALVTAMAQGVVASIGFAIAGVPNLVLLGFLATLGGFVPLVGPALVWVPVAVWATITRGWGWGVFVAAWNLGLTGTVDNVLRPFLLRGRSPIHPLPIFLGVFGGIGWMGPAGALVGPVLVAACLALYRIWTEENPRPPEAG